jgi:hypothetical protein
MGGTQATSQAKRHVPNGNAKTARLCPSTKIEDEVIMAEVIDLFKCLSQSALNQLSITQATRDTVQQTEDCTLCLYFMLYFYCAVHDIALATPSPYGWTGKFHSMTMCGRRSVQVTNRDERLCGKDKRNREQTTRPWTWTRHHSGSYAHLEMLLELSASCAALLNPLFR